MKKFLKTIARFRRNDEGVTLVEYGIAITLAVTLGGGALALLADDIGDGMTSAGSAICANVTCD